MSHAAGAEKAEPNLTPLLDLVLQLIMFFMISINFVNEEVNEEIKLPISQAARPMSKSEGEVLFMNLNKNGELAVPGREPMDLIGMKVYIRQAYKDAARLSKDGKVNTAIVIRADESADYANVFKVMQACKEEGFNRLKLRANSQG